MPELKGVDGLSEPLLRLYSSLAGENPWVEFLTVLRRQLHASFATIILTPPTARTPAIVVTPGVPDFEIGAAVKHFSKDPFVGLPEGRVLTANEFVGREAYRQSCFYQQYVASYGIEDIMGLDLLAKSGFQMRMRICCGAGRSGFTEEDKQWLGYFVPHLRAALDLYERFEIEKGEENIYDTAVEQLSVGSILLDGSGAVIRCNLIARNLLEQRDGIRLVNNRLAFSDTANERSFRDFLRASGPALTSRISFMQAERHSGKPSLGIIARRLAMPPSLKLGFCPAIAVFITDPQQQAGVTGAAVANVLRLTPMEAEIAASLANGLSLLQISEVFGITQNTVRAHLRSVFSKVGVSRQSQLVQRVRTSVSGLIVQMSSGSGAPRRRSRQGAPLLRSAGAGQDRPQVKQTRRLSHVP